MSDRIVDVLIAGGGLPGLALAVALKRARGPGVAVAVCDPAFGGRPPGTRASAIAPDARRWLGELGVWSKVAPEAQPILAMAITDSRLADPVRPVLLQFGGELAPGEPLAHMLFNDDLAHVLRAEAERLGVALVSAAASSATPGRDDSRVAVGDRTFRARLVVAADGAASRLREDAGIRCVAWDYGQDAIVATIAHEHDHGGRAEQHFLPAGSFAVLPLTGGRSSLVWVESRRDAARIVALRPAAFLAELGRRAGHRLGPMTLVDTPRVYPLRLQTARAFVGARLALVGDSARVVHPLAGQGLNLGLRDAATLAACVLDRLALGLDPGDAAVLARYQRARRPESVAMTVATDALNRLFATDALPLRLARDFGLGLVDRLPGLKDRLARRAAGNSRPGTTTPWRPTDGRG